MITLILRIALHFLSDKEEKTIQLPNVAGKCLANIVKYMKNYMLTPPPEINRPLKSANLKEQVPEYDNEFITTDDDTIFDLIFVRATHHHCRSKKNIIFIQACNYLDYKPLLDLACAKVASEIYGRSAQQIRDRFNLVNDLTPEYVLPPKLFERPP